MAQQFQSFFLTGSSPNDQGRAATEQFSWFTEQKRDAMEQVPTLSNLSSEMTAKAVFCKICPRWSTISDGDRASSIMPQMSAEQSFQLSSPLQLSMTSQTVSSQVQELKLLMKDQISLLQTQINDMERRISNLESSVRIEVLYSYHGAGVHESTSAVANKQPLQGQQWTEADPYQLPDEIEPEVARSCDLVMQLEETQSKEASLTLEAPISHATIFYKAMNPFVIGIFDDKHIQHREQQRFGKMPKPILVPFALFAVLLDVLPFLIESFNITFPRVLIPWHDHAYINGDFSYKIWKPPWSSSFSEAEHNNIKLEANEFTCITLYTMPKIFHYPEMTFFELMEGQQLDGKLYGKQILYYYQQVRSFTFGYDYVLQFAIALWILYAGDSDLFGAQLLIKVWKQCGFKVHFYSDHHQASLRPEFIQHKVQLKSNFVLEWTLRKIENKIVILVWLPQHYMLLDLPSNLNWSFSEYWALCILMLYRTSSNIFLDNLIVEFGVICQATCGIARVKSQLVTDWRRWTMERASAISIPFHAQFFMAILKSIWLN